MTPMPNPADTARILEKLRRLHIDTPRDATFATHLDRLLSRDDEGALRPEPLRFSVARETRGIMVIDGPGGGKSTLIAHALARHQAFAVRPDGQTGYLAASVPSPATLKSTIGHLLERSGYPLQERRREAWSLVQVLRTRCAMLGIVLIWLDEAHDLFCADRDLILRAIKSLMQGDEAVIVILSGTERLAEIVRSDPQVQRRFSTLILTPVAEAVDGPQFRSVIDSYCRIAGLHPPMEADLVPRLFHASRYRFGRCVETIIGSIERALDGGVSRLDIGHFAESWALQEGCVPGGNVFTAPDWANIAPDRVEDEDVVRTTRSRKRRK